MIIRDPVHGLIDFSGPACPVIEELLDTREVQRLRRIRQLGVAALAFPGAEHSRFGHALGTAHVMVRLCRALKIDEAQVAPAAAAALLHDVGHPPLSHLMEAALSGREPHERWSLAVVRSSETEVGSVLARHGLQRAVAELLAGTYAARLLCAALSSPLDVDRFDYLLRDSHHTGARYGVFDLDWLLSSLLLAQAPTPAGERLVLAVDGRRGLRAVEGYLMARLSMFQQVYFHKTSRAAEFMFKQLLRRVGDLLARGEAPAPIPDALARMLRGEAPALKDYLGLDDPCLWTCVQRWAASADAVISQLARGLLDRRLLRTLPLPRDMEAQEDRILERARELTAAAGFDADAFCGLDRAVDVPYHVDPGASERIWVVGLGRPGPLAEVSPIVEVLRGGQVGRTIVICPRPARDALAEELA